MRGGREGREREGGREKGKVGEGRVREGGREGGGGERGGRGEKGREGGEREEGVKKCVVPKEGGRGSGRIEYMQGKTYPQNALFPYKCPFHCSGSDFEALLAGELGSQSGGEGEQD